MSVSRVGSELSDECVGVGDGLLAVLVVLGEVGAEVCEVSSEGVGDEESGESVVGLGECEETSEVVGVSLSEGVGVEFGGFALSVFEVGGGVAEGLEGGRGGDGGGEVSGDEESGGEECGDGVGVGVLAAFGGGLCEGELLCGEEEVEGDVEADGGVAESGLVAVELSADAVALEGGRGGGRRSWRRGRPCRR